MNKLQQIKEAMRNPPAERLAKIEYRSHLYQALGIMFASIVLISKGLWYVIFAFIFGVGISYSQGIKAYQKYKTIMKFKEPEKMEDYEKDISPTRRKSKIIKSVMPYASWIVIILSVIFPVFIIDPTLSRWILMVIYPLTIILTYIILYFFIAYWIAYPIYKRRI